MKNKKVLLSLLIAILLVFVTSCVKTNKITFDFQYDKIDNYSLKVKVNERITFPNEQREGYDFAGWYKDSECNEKFTKKYLNTDITVYAKWTKALGKYHINFDLNGGKLENINANFDDASLYVLPTPIKSGYKFVGWYENDVIVTELENRDYDLVAKYEVTYTKVADPIIERVRSEYTEYKNIVYTNVGGHNLKMDLYLPALSADETCPVLVAYFGGGWIMGSKEDVPTFLEGIIDYVVNNKVAVAIPNYRLAYEAKYPYPTCDAIDAIRFLVKYKDLIGIDVNNIGTIGYSAGGYMALMAGFAQDAFEGDPELKDYTYKAKYIVDMYGPSVFDMSSLAELSMTGMYMLSQFFGTTNFFDPNIATSMASSYITCNNPDVYIVHGTADTTVPVSQSQKFYDMLIGAGINASITLVEGAEHTLEVASGYTMTTPSIEEVYLNISKFIVEEVKK